MAKAPAQETQRRWYREGPAWSNMDEVTSIAALHHCGIARTASVDGPYKNEATTKCILTSDGLPLVTHIMCGTSIFPVRTGGFAIHMNQVAEA